MGIFDFITVPSLTQKEFIIRAEESKEKRNKVNRELNNTRFAVQASKISKASTKSDSNGQPKSDENKFQSDAVHSNKIDSKNTQGKVNTLNFPYKSNSRDSSNKDQRRSNNLDSGQIISHKTAAVYDNTVPDLY
jgi:hypothetical protein